MRSTPAFDRRLVQLSFTVRFADADYWTKVAQIEQEIDRDPNAFPIFDTPRWAPATWQYRTRATSEEKPGHFVIIFEKTPSDTVAIWPFFDAEPVE